MTKIYRVSYYEWYYTKYDDKDFEYRSHWVSEESLANLQADRYVDHLEIHEEQESDEDWAKSL